MEIKQKARLVRLGDSQLEIANPEQDIRGKRIIDSSGAEMGKIHDLYVDESERKVRLVEVHSGGLLGFAKSVELVPVDAIRKIADDEVLLAHPWQRVATSPRYNPELVDDQFLTQVYGHYGYTPFWSQGYMYPAYPFFV